MHRHHPYGGGGGGYESAPRRGGASGPGPDRSHRFERGGHPPRGRGSGPMSRPRPPYQSYDTMSGYDSAPPSDLNGYSGYDAASQDPYYQSYGNPTSQFSQVQPYDQNYGNYEGASGYGDSDSHGTGYRGGGPGGRRPAPRRERDDKVHDSIIEERISRERPCRTLFIRNIKYETNSDDVRRMFEEHGDIKTFFDLISNRGMVFVTFHDLRAAERARDRLQGSEISGRPIDVHYSLPRDDHGNKNADKDQRGQQYQGVIDVSLRSPSGMPIDDMELRRKLQPFGDIKSIMPSDGRPDARLVEFYDMRASEDAYERLKHQPLQDGMMDIQLCWDNTLGNSSGGGGGPSSRGSHGGGERDYDEVPRRGRGGPRGRGRGRGGGGRMYDDDYDRRGDYHRDRRGGPPGRYDDDFRGGGYSDRGYGGGPPPRGPAGYGGPSRPPYNEPPRPPFNPPPPPSANATPIGGGGGEDRLEQARKVQQLLAALKQPQSTTSSSTPPAPPAAPASSSGPGYYGQPSAQPPYLSGSAVTAPYSGTAAAPPPQSTTPQPGQPAPPNAASLAGLPPHVYALLQQVQSQAQQNPNAAGQTGAPYGSGMTPPPTAATGPGYQQLMSYLGQKSG